MSAVLAEDVLPVWGSRMRTVNANRINTIMWKAASVLGVQLDSLVVVSERRMLCKL